MVNSFALIAASTVSNIVIANSLMIAAAHSKETANLFLWKVLMCWHYCSFLTIKFRLLDYSCLINQTTNKWFYGRR